MYLPAQGSGEDFGAVLDDLAEMIEARGETSSFIICGDMNADLGHKGGPRSTRDPNRHGNILYDFVQEFGLTACNYSSEAKGPLDTYVGPTGSSTIDLIMVSADLSHMVSSCHTSDDEALNTSDHNVVSITLEVENVRAAEDNARTNKRTRWDKLSPEDIKIKYTLPLESDLMGMIGRLTGEGISVSNSTIDDCFEEVVTALKSRSKVIPTTKFRRNLRPYWNENLTALKKEKVRKYRAWVDRGRPRIKGDVYWEGHKAARKAFTRERRRLHKEYENDSVKEVINAAGLIEDASGGWLRKAGGATDAKLVPLKTKMGRLLTIWTKY